MWTDMKNKSTGKFSHEILGLALVVAVISLFLYYLLSGCAMVVTELFCQRRQIVLTEAQWMQLDSWIHNIGLMVAVGFFVVLFLILIGERMAYIKEITKGIQAMQEGRLNYELPLEGKNELTQLADAVNFLSTTQQQMKEKEEKMQQEREQLIHTLSHDIRTPLTSILSYSEYLLSKKGDLTEEEAGYLKLIQQKGEQIREMTAILLDGSKRNIEHFEDGRLLMNQLADEFEEELDEYQVLIEYDKFPSFSGKFDVQELRRIFDNLSSNVKKYGDIEYPVLLQINMEEQGLTILQKNRKNTQKKEQESLGLGLNSIRRIAYNYKGKVEVSEDALEFQIKILLSDF